jgi:hypothetical protein
MASRIPDSPSSYPGIFATILAVFRQNCVPCLVLKALAVALVVSCYLVPAMVVFVLGFAGRV